MITKFLPGRQIEVTPLIKEIATEFLGQPIPEVFQQIHTKVYSLLRIVPYTNENKGYEESRRWKLTAAEVLETGEIIDTKYCNDVVTVYIALLKALGINAYLAKVFRKLQTSELQVHSFVIVKRDDGRVYLVNTGDKDYFWYKRLKFDVETLSQGKELPYDWVVWKCDIDQWAMRLYDASQEVVIERFANSYYSRKRRSLD